MGINNNRGMAIVLFFGVILGTMPEPAESAITPAQTPLYIGVSAAKPNIMLMVDNSGSMSASVTVGGTTPLAPDAVTGSSSCSGSRRHSGGASTAAGATTAITMQVFSGSAKFCPDSGSCTGSNSTSFGNSNGKKCFNTSKYYNISGLGVYKGDQLNRFFNTYNGSFNGSLGSITSSTTRLQIVKDAATSFINSLKPATGASPTVRLGLARYNNDDGGELLSAIGDLDSTKATTMINQIAGFSANAYTPLAETLSDIGRYFTTGYTGDLVLHPGGGASTSAALADIFNNHSIRNSTGSALANPVQGACQKSSVIILSDGLPSSDRNISTYLQDYDGDCSGDNSGNCGRKSGGGWITPHYDMKRLYNYPSQCNNSATATCVSSNAGGNSSDYLDDVAQALFEMDLRPDLAKINGEKNNLSTYTVGFADPAIDPSLAGVNPLLSDTATNGGGQFIYADNTTALADALGNIASSIISKVSSSSSVVANSAKLGTDAAIYQGKFDSADWTGDLSMFPLGVSEDINGNGILDTGEDSNNNQILDAGTVGTALWNAAEHIPAFGSRNIFTYDSAGSPKGVAFECANLTADQKTALVISDCSSATDQGVWRLNYIRGDWSHEEKKPARTDTDTIRSTTAADRIFRNRTHLDKATRAKVGPDPWVLGDIVNSNPVYVSDENYGYDKLSGTEGTSYKAFVISNASRRKMVYVGANDGMLHGFDASPSGTDAGKEILAYVPNAVFSSLNELSSPDYVHQYLVDGSPRVADAYFGNAWHTILVSTTGAGGKAAFALDVTDPSSFDGGDVLWEISDTDSPVTSDRTTDTAALRGFANNMGYTLPQASIVKMHNGSWAAIVANGYGSANNLAVLYIIDVQTGSIITAIDTKAGSSAMPNGLSTPIAVDADADRIVDAIYAGDLLGNLWKFDVSSSNPNQWKVAYGTTATPAPLFIACVNQGSCDATRQPITAKPQVSQVGPGQSTGMMVYFGTGKYFETIDNNVTNAQIQTFYGIWDNNGTVAKNDLQDQAITAEVTKGGFNLRVTTDNTVDYPTQKGWYLDLLNPSATTSDGERVVSAPLLRHGRIVFNTLIPIPPSGGDICGAGSEGTSWLMELDALTGSRLSGTGGLTPWDITGDGIIDSNDLVIINDISAAPSGKQSTVGSAGTPGVVSSGKLEYKYTSGSNAAQIEVTTELGSSGSPGGRQSWRQQQ
ncbi:pilus assembly protein [Methylobacter marinus]|jgi:type IV pilus assembly protein PilY1|uniref:pilus assembly protein n=1 Tax=Methylobacter marinus TaxID=34058 RepID=UPI0003A00A64|nr:PilC/PilY family type IV pilus protein [Methylobacter marinus]